MLQKLRATQALTSPPAKAISPTITVGNSICSIQGITAEQYNDLRQILSYTENGYFSGFGPRKKVLIDRKGAFPTGLLYLVERYFTNMPTPILTTIDNRIVPSKVEFPAFDCSHTPYPEQTAAARAAANEHRGIIVAPTGVGKSVMAGLIIDQLHVPTLVVVPSINLKDQLIDRFKQFFGKLSVGEYADNRLITVENVDALNLNQTRKFDCVIIDEFHHAAAKTYRELNKKIWCNTYYKFGLTATPFRSKDEEQILMESVLSKVIYEIPYTIAVEKKYIVPMQAFYANVPKQKLKCNEDNWSSVYSAYIVNNAVRNRICMDFIKELYTNNISTLVLVKQIDHGHNLVGNLITEGFDIPFAKGDNDDNTGLIADFVNKKFPVLIGTGVIGEGVDTTACEYVILLGGGKSRNQLMQAVGRGFRNYPGKTGCKIIMFKDPSHKWLKKHFSTCVKTLKEEYGIECQELKE